MAAETVPYGRSTQRPPAVKDIHIVWITAGLGCDGDSVSITAATQPSVEDVVMGAIPGLPKVHLHNPVLAYEVGDDFLKYYYQAEQGLIDPFVLVVEGSIPNENISGEGYWAAVGNDVHAVAATRWRGCFRSLACRKERDRRSARTRLRRSRTCRCCD